MHMIKTLKQNIIFKNNFLELQNNDVIYNNKEVKFLKIFLNKNRKLNSWAVVFCINEYNEILIIKNYRYAIDDIIWELPRWWLDWDEKYIPAAIRELKEECNIGIIKESILLWEVNTDSWILASKVGIVLIRVQKSSNIIKLQKEENIVEYKWVSEININSMIINNMIHDSFLILALHLYNIQK